MNDTTDNKDKTGGNRPGGTLTLKRPAVEQSRVKQSFSHGRTKTVVVETKRKRFGDDKPASAPAPEAKPAFQQQPRVTPTPSQTQRPAPQQASRAGVVLTPNSAAIPRKVMLAPGAISPCITRARRLR